MGRLILEDIGVMKPILGDVLRPVLCGQFTVSTYCAGGLYYILQYAGPPNQFLYAIGGAPYVGLYNPDGNATNLDQVFQSMQDSLTNTLTPCMKANAMLASEYGLQYCCYEGGQGLPCMPESTYDLMYSAQLDPRMQTIYTNWASMLQEYGASVCNIECASGVWSKYGFWADLPMGSLISNPPLRYQIDSGLANTANGRLPKPPKKPVKRKK